MALTFGFCAFFLNPTSPSQFGYFLWGMLTMFFFSGIGNAGTFKQMPMIMPARQAGGAIGFTAAIGCFGPATPLQAGLPARAKDGINPNGAEHQILPPCGSHP